MKEIKCPNCGEVFQVDEKGYAAIASQVRDAEFQRELNERREQFESEKAAAVRLAQAETEKQMTELKGKLELMESEKKLALQKQTTEQETETARLRDEYEKKLRDKEAEIEYYRDLKIRLSTKMIGETLEQHCENEFNKLRATAFPNAYFEKDNDAKTGSKGDYIYRESGPDGTEFISIMFEMKNENDETASKKKNEHFFQELDKDRNQKGCEYAVLVSLLEPESELYNTGIVDVSHRYPKMYVIRPQFFIPLISLLRNAAVNSLEVRQELARARAEHIDITNFEDRLVSFKDDFSANVQKAGKRHSDAIEEIKKAIERLEKVKKALEGSDEQLRIAEKKVQDITVRRLTYKNPTMAAKFKELRDEKGESS